MNVFDYNRGRHQKPPFRFVAFDSTISLQHICFTHRAHTYIHIYTTITRIQPYSSVVGTKYKILHEQIEMVSTYRSCFSAYLSPSNTIGNHSNRITDIQTHTPNQLIVKQ